MPTAAFVRESALSKVINDARPGTQSYEDALVNGVRLLEVHPHAALQQADTLLRSGPEPRALELAGAALRRIRKPIEAEDRELSAIKASFGIRTLEAAAIAGREGRAQEARSMLERFLTGHPGNLLASTMLAELLLDDWQLSRAEEMLRGVLARAPSFLRAIMLLAKCLTNAGRLEEAMEIVQGVLTRKPDNRTALRSLAQLYAETNEHSRAAQLYERLLELEPGNPDISIIQAQELRILGRKQESIEAFRRVIATDPGNGGAWWGLAYYFPAAIDQGDREAIQRALEGVPDGEDSAPLHIAMSIVKEREGDFAAAFRHVAEGKRSRSRTQPYDAGAARTEIQAMLGQTLPALESSPQTDPAEPGTPIFIVGMPRSGTTLLERIIGGHSLIEACGELPIMPRLEHILRHEVRSPDGEKLFNLNPERLRNAGKRYLECSRAYRKTGKPHFVDKLNFNWTRSGLIRLILPNARIIDLRRNALDCCWSNYKMMFSEGHTASNDQRDIARFYRDYVETIEAIDHASPGGILRLRYEELVEDVEGQARLILDFLGLSYEPQCVEFHLSCGAVATPSSEQVRRPINRDRRPINRNGTGIR